MNSHLKRALAIFAEKKRWAIDEACCFDMLAKVVPLLCGLPEVNEQAVEELAYHCATCEVNEAIAIIKQWIHERWTELEIYPQLTESLRGNDVPGRWSLAAHVALREPVDFAPWKTNVPDRDGKYRTG